jgi:hypothetical protein
MTTALLMRVPALQALGVDAPDDAMAKIRAAIKRAPKGPPLSAEERACVAECRRGGYAGTSAEDFMAQLATLGPDDADAEE